MNLKDLPFTDRSHVERSPEDIHKAVVDLFTYKSWDPDQEMKGICVREALANAYETIIKNVPACATRWRATHRHRRV